MVHLNINILELQLYKREWGLLKHLKVVLITFMISVWVNMISIWMKDLSIMFVLVCLPVHV